MSKLDCKEEEVCTDFLLRHVFGGGTRHHCTYGGNAGHLIVSRRLQTYQLISIQSLLDALYNKDGKCNGAGLKYAR